MAFSQIGLGNYNDYWQQQQSYLQNTYLTTSSNATSNVTLLSYIVGEQAQVAPTVPHVTAPDEFTWLRRRVEETCWRN